MDHLISKIQWILIIPLARASTGRKVQKKRTTKVHKTKAIRKSKPAASPAADAGHAPAHSPKKSATKKRVSKKGGAKKKGSKKGGAKKRTGKRSAKK